MQKGNFFPSFDSFSINDGCWHDNCLMLDNNKTFSFLTYRFRCCQFQKWRCPKNPIIKTFITTACRQRTSSVSTLVLSACRPHVIDSLSECTNFYFSLLDMKNVASVGSCHLCQRVIQLDCVLEHMIDTPVPSPVTSGQVWNIVSRRTNRQKDDALFTQSIHNAIVETLSQFSFYFPLGK